MIELAGLFAVVIIVGLMITAVNDLMIAPDDEVLTEGQE